MLKTNPKRGNFWQGVTGAIEKDESLPMLMREDS
jgi:hypothetical protein